MIQRTIGSLESYVLTYPRQNGNQKFNYMISRALSALRFLPYSKTKLTPVEAHHRREAITVLRNLTKKPSLKNLERGNVIKQNLQCLDGLTDGQRSR